MAHLIRWFTYWKCWFSIAMLNCQKVTGNQSQIKVSSKWSKPLVARAQLLGWPSKVLGGSKILWKPPLNSVGSISPGLALYIFYNIYRVWGHNKKNWKALGSAGFGAAGVAVATACKVTAWRPSLLWYGVMLKPISILTGLACKAASPRKFARMSVPLNPWKSCLHEPLFSPQKPWGQLRQA